MIADLKYEGLNEQEKNKLTMFYLSQWRGFVDQYDSSLMEGKDYFVHKKNLYEVVRRTDKWLQYYVTFHGIEADSLCEYREVALQAFFLCCLKPFMVVKEDSDLYNTPNEMFSLHLIFSMIRKIFDRARPEEKFVYPDQSSVWKYVYALKYRHLNREAVILFVETLAQAHRAGTQDEAVKQLIAENTKTSLKDKK